MLLISLVICITNSQTLFYSAFSDITLTQTDSNKFIRIDWTFLNIDPSNIITQCGSEYIIGGFEKFAHLQAATKILQLPPHYRMKISLKLFIIDSWDINEFFQVYVDQKLLYNVAYSALVATVNICGQQQSFTKDQIHDIQFEYDHTGLTTYLYLTSTLDGSSWDESWGFKNFKLFLYLCPPGCQVCTQNDSDIECATWILTHSSYTEIDYASFNQDGWTISNGDLTKQQCQMIPTICGYGVCGKDTVLSLNLMNLPFHTKMKIKLKYLKKGSWELSDRVQLKVDGELIWDQKLSSLNQYLYGICGTAYQDVYINVELTFSHSMTSSTVLILNTLDEGSSDESFGIRDIQIFLKQSICGDRLVELEEECDDGNLFPFDGCFSCMFSCVVGCSICKDMICLGCFQGWTYLEYEQICEQQIYQENSQITFVVEQSQIQCFPPIDQCQVCLFGSCILCRKGFFYNQFKSTCESICDDQIELCNEQQLSPFYQIQCSDHCLQCNQSICWVCDNDYFLENHYCVQFEKINLCQSQCEICIENICYKCQSGQFLILGQCQEICGNYMALYTLEECICDIYCEECIAGICYQCNDNFKLLNNKCINTCGDLVVQEYEDCDDSNDIEFDGCFYCKYSCPIECINCIKGICLDRCLLGFYLINNICSTICGDSIKAGNEQCEDNNAQEFDGCYRCEFSCPLYCNECIDGICFNCNYGFQLIENMCRNVCGDGIQSNKEQCDDGNQISGDGCSQSCQVETDWICNQGNDCTFVKYPILMCEFMMQKNQYQYAKIKFSQAVQQLSDINYQETIELSINDLNSTLYNITIKEVQSAQFQVTSDVEYILQIEIFTSLSYYPILKVKLTSQLYSSNLAPLVSMVDYLQLNQPNYLTDQQVQIAQTVQMISQISIKTIYALSIILIILGNMLSFWGILDALQQQSYLKFINVLYPQTLIIYFQSSELISVQSILNSITTLNKRAKLLQFPYLESYGKFQFYEINADITEGFRTEVLVSLTLFFCYLCILILERVISILEMSAILQDFPKFIRFLQRQQRKLDIQIKKIDMSFIKSTLFACSWDLIFMAFIELYSYHDFSYFRSYVRLAITFVILITIITLILSQISGVISWKKYNLQQFWLQKQPVFLLIKKILIISILVFYQREQILQTLLLTFINTLYLIYIINLKNTEDFQSQIKNIIMETSLTLFTASTFLNWDILSRYLQYNFIIIVSWIQMFLLVSVLISFMFFELYNFINLIKRIITKSIEKRMSKIKSNEQKQSQNKDNQIQNPNSDLQKTIFQRVAFVNQKHIQK